MASRLLKLDDVRHIESPDKIAFLFQKLGYNASAQQLAVDDLELSPKSAEAIWKAHLIADQGKGALQVLLFQLQAEEFSSPAIASNRMRAIAQSLGRRPSNFLLLGTRDYNQLMLVNPRKSFDAQMNLKTSIRKLLIDRTNPTNYDRDRLEAIAARDLDPEKLYKAQCEAFDVEKLTKQFYTGYEKLFDSVQKVVQQHNPHPYFEDPSRLHQFTQRLLGRTMFLYFLQKKEFLGGDRNFLTTQYRKRQCTSELEGIDFYSKLLEPLFFETLNKQRPNLDSAWGQIPYLNGGLFDWDYGPGIQDTAGRSTPDQIQLPNSLFDSSSANGILGFFNGYNFTVAENVQGDEDVAVDPEMLGKVFENLLAKEERGQSGTFYTPRGIVHFMCVESLSRYLADSSGMSLDAIKQLIELDPDSQETTFNQLLSKEQARALKQALDTVKICDPAVGSGAFPLGMMQVILSVRQAIARREGMTVQRGSLMMSQWKRDIIANNLYGVDIKPEAIEIAKLRMWLSLVVDVPTIEDLEPLPNLDYKLMCGDSLISTINGEQLIPDPARNQQLELNVTPIQAAIQPLLKLQQQYYSAQYEERKALRQQIIEAEKNVFRVATADRDQFWNSKQRKVEQDVKRLGRASRTQVKEQQVIVEKLAGLEKFAAEVERGKRSLNFFQYYLHFSDVFESKGGFDVVIGNPPYVRQEQIKELKPALAQEYECYTGLADLYVYFYERGFSLLKSGGHLTYISSNKYFRTGYGEKLRKFLGEKAIVEILIDFGDASVFEAIAYPSIILVNKAKPKNHSAHVLNWEMGQSVDEVASVFKKSSFLLLQKELAADGWRLESPIVLRLLDKLRTAGTPLGKYINGRFYRGIVTGCNEAFVVNRATRDRLIAEHESSAEVLKPFLRGRDIKRWSVTDPDLWLLFIPWHFPLHEDNTITGASTDAEKEFLKLYPAVFNHLLHFKSHLSARNRSETGISYEWYALQRCAATYWREFSQPKIIIPAIAQSVEYAPALSEHFSNDKTSICVTSDVNYLLGLLNSKVLWWFIQQTASTKQGGFYEFKPMYVSQLPIPTATITDRLSITSLVQKCLDAKGQGVAHWEAEINERVGYLYGLTDADMKQIMEH